MTASRSPCSLPGSVPASASTEVRVGGGPRRQHGRVLAEQTGLRSEWQWEGSLSLLAREAADSTLEKAGGKGRI